MDKLKKNITFLYIGGFELPDKNAAAQRVVSIGKILRELNYNVYFSGISKSNILNGIALGFQYNSTQYPTNIFSWVKYSLGRNIIKHIKQINPDYVITYNYPAVAQERIIRFCHKRGIKVIGDITEWYSYTNIVKHFDSTLRMRYSNKNLDGIIAISRYLEKFYKEYPVLYLPPLVDKHEQKWVHTRQKHDTNLIRLIYVGSPAGGKDRLDYILNGLNKVGHNKFVIDIVGITQEQYQSVYTYHDISQLNVTFHGRLEHLEALELLKNSDFQIFFRDSIRSNNAGFPTKLVESISAKIPVITNRISNISEYIVHGKNGFIIDDPTEDNIVNILREVAKLNYEQIYEMKKNCDDNIFDYRNYINTLKTFVDIL